VGLPVSLHSALANWDLLQPEGEIRSTRRGRFAGLGLALPPRGPQAECRKVLQPPRVTGSLIAPWLGHSPKVADEHYLMSREHHFEHVVNGGVATGGRA
jgi:hypothetical protein